MRTPEQAFLFYLTVIVGFLLFSLGETEWLNRRTKAGIFPLLLIAFASNILSLVLSHIFSYIIYLISVVAFGARESPALWALILFGGIVVVAAPPLAIIKLLLLKLAKIRGLPRPWIYAFVTAALFQLVMVGLFLLAAYFV